MAVTVLQGEGDSTSTVASTSTPSITAAIPANTVAGDVLIATVAADASNPILCDTAGWVRISTPRSGTMRDVAVFHAFTAAGIPAAPVFSTAAAAARLSAGVFRVLGAHQSIRAAAAGGWATTADTANGTSFVIPATGAEPGGITVAVGYNNANSTQQATTAATFDGAPADFQATSYGSGAGNPSASSSTSQAVRFSATPGPFTLAWGKTVANAQGSAVTIPAAGETPPDPDAEEPEIPSVPNTPDVAGLAIQSGPWNITTARNSKAGVQEVSPRIPQNTKVGDVLLAVITHQYTTGISFPPGWQLISAERPSGSAARQLQVYAYRVFSLPVPRPVFGILASNEGRMAATVMRLTGASETEVLAAAGAWPSTEPDNITGFTIPALTGLPSGTRQLVAVYGNSSAGGEPPTVTVADGTSLVRVAAQAPAAAATTLDVFVSTTATAKEVTFSGTAANASGFQLALQPYTPPPAPAWEARLYEDGVMHPAVLEGIQSSISTRQEIELVGWRRRNFTVTDLLSTTPFYIAHRGSGDSWPEHTMAAYTNATAFGVKALELSICTTSDGVMFCHHDLTLLKMTGLTLPPISELTWAEVQALWFDTREWTGEGTPLSRPVRVEEVLDAYLPTHVIFIEDKQGTNTTGLLNLMDSYPQYKDHFVWKQYAGAGQWEAAKNRGYKVWGYFMTDTFSRIQELAPRFDLLGIPHTASDAIISEIAAVSQTTGKPLICWEVHYRWMRDRLLALGVQGMMTSNIPYVYSTSVAQSDTDSFATGRRAHGDLPHGTDSWAIQPRIIPGSGILSFDMRQAVGYLLGSMCPIPSDTYTIDFSMRYAGDTQPSTAQHAGLWFGHDVDKAHRSGVADTVGGYHLIYRGNGVFDLMRHDPGTTGGIPLASAAGPVPVLGQWMKFRVSVSPFRISATRLDVSGVSVETSDTTFRGGYFGVQKNYSTAVDVPFPFTEFQDVSWEVSQPAG